MELMDSNQYSPSPPGSHRLEVVGLESLKRPVEGPDGAPRSKRGKYTSVACNECKKKKLKCVPFHDGTRCQRCAANRVDCVFAAVPPQGNKKRDDGQHMHVLSETLAKLQKQVEDLSSAVEDLKSPAASVKSARGSSLEEVNARSPSNTSRSNVPKHPHFVGPTRPSYGLMIAERSLTRMGIPGSPSPSPSARSSVGEDMDRVEVTDTSFWAECTSEEMNKFLAVFEEEVESVYPFIDISELALKSEQILKCIRKPRLLEDGNPSSSDLSVTTTDVQLAKVAVATGIAIEAHGKNNLCASIAESVVAQTSRLSRSEVTLKGIQLLIMLSIYYFHCDDELLAWRTIGVAAREALELGLHRQKSLEDNFFDPKSLHMAKRVFWCCYVLDRRWSFGTSLSFALADRDIDPTLLEANIDSSYLKCMVEYARLASKVWDVIPPLGAPSQSIPRDVVDKLDASTRAWIESIPPHLQLRPAGSSASSRSQPRVLHRLRALLYLRGNLTLISLHQHLLVSAASIKADPQRVQAVVKVAQDTIRVLVQLNASSDIYSRQQNAFNYFLLSAFAVVSLAICHAPEDFTATCAQSFNEAVGLVRGFSRHSIASRRLWNSIRELLPRLKMISSQTHGEGVRDYDSQASLSEPPTSMPMPREDVHSHSPYDARGNEMWSNNNRQPMVSTTVNHGYDSGIPDASVINSDILSLFDNIGQDSVFQDGFDPGIYFPVAGNGENNCYVGPDMSRRFMQGLM